MNIIENNPYFSASWNPNVMKRVVIGIASYILSINTLCIILYDNHQPFSFDTVDNFYMLDLENISRYSQPIVIRPKDIIDNMYQLTLKTTNTFRNINPVISADTYLFSFYTTKKDFTLILEPYDHVDFLLFIKNAKIGKIVAYLKIAHLAFCIMLLIYSNQVQTLIFYKISIFFAVIYILHRLNIFLVDTLLDKFISTFFWLIFTLINYSQSKLLNSSYSIIKMFLFVLTGISAILLMLGVVSNAFAFISIPILILLKYFYYSLYLKGKAVFSQVLINAHISFYSIVSFSMCFSILVRNNSIIFSRSAFTEMVDIICLTSDIVFQVFLVITDRVNKPRRESSVESVIGNQSDRFLQILTERSKEEETVLEQDCS